MNFLIIALVLLSACQRSVTDYSFISIKGVSVKKAEVCAEHKPAPNKVMDKEEVCEAVEDRIYFDTDKYNVGEMERMQCERYASYYKKHGGGKLIIDGHCDERGSRDYNMGLGMRRAAAVKDALVESGVPGDMITVRSFGKDKPIVWGSNPEAWAKNRVSIIRAV